MRYRSCVPGNFGLVVMQSPQAVKKVGISKGVDVDCEGSLRNELDFLHLIPDIYVFLGGFANFEMP